MDPYVAFLSNKSLPENGKEAKKVQRTVARFWLFSDKKLYQCSFGGPYLLCLSSNEAAKLLFKLLEGVCGLHLKEDPSLTEP